MTKPIVQEVAFKNCTPKQVYDLYMDPKKHSAITGTKVTIEPKPGGKFSAWGGGLSGKFLQLVKDKMIVQSWRSDAFKKTDLDSTLVLQFHAQGNDTILHMVHANVPEQDHKGVTEGWKTYYWLPMKDYLVSLKKR